MSKLLCKWGRHEIAASLGEISRLVSAPSYVCHSCARVANQSSSLCKPLKLVQTNLQQQELKSSDSLAKKQLKQKKKAQKKLKKLVKKQLRLMKKCKKLEQKITSQQHYLDTNTEVESFVH